MLNHCSTRGLLRSIATIGLALATASTLNAQTAPIQLPTCGGDPVANTLAMQQAIDQAPAGSTLTLPSGECVLAKCDVAKGKICYGAFGRPHLGALYIGNRSSLTFVGAADGTSVLKLDPNPPLTAAGYHAYCGDTHVMVFQGSSFMTLRGFTIDGSDGELPEDANQCAGPSKIAERMFDVYLLNSSDVTIDRMNLIKAHGDGLNLAAQRLETSIPHTERVSVTNTNFLDDDRSGIAFQRNVGYVTIRGNYFKGSGADQDLDMEPSGGAEDFGPYQVDIDNNLFERVTTGSSLAVTLGSAGGTQRSNGIRFTGNTIRPGAGAAPDDGGCVFVYHADNTVIANNHITGAATCVPISAQKVSGLTIQNNTLRGRANLHLATGFFTPSAVIAITERIVNQGDTTVCGAPPQPSQCPYYIYYPTELTITGNTIIQEVQNSPAIKLSNPDALVIANNAMWTTQRIAPAYPFNTHYPIPRAESVTITFGVQNLPSYGYYLNERMGFRQWQMSGNQFLLFDDGIKVQPLKPGVVLRQAAIADNFFSTLQVKATGIGLVGPVAAPNDGFISNLFINGNLFACGFPSEPFPFGGTSLPKNVLIKPSGQLLTGNIGSTTTCKPPVITK
jgi:hypothetical protein